MSRNISTQEPARWAPAIECAQEGAIPVSHVWTYKEPRRPIESLYRAAGYTVRVLSTSGDLTVRCTCDANFFEGQVCEHMAAVAVELGYFVEEEAVA